MKTFFGLVKQEYLKNSFHIKSEKVGKIRIPEFSVGIMGSSASLRGLARHEYFKISFHIKSEKSESRIFRLVIWAILFL